MNTGNGDSFSYSNGPEAFASAFTPGTFAGNTPRNTMLGALAPGLKANINNTSAMQGVQAHKAGAAAMVQPSMQMASSVKGQATNCQASVTQTLQRAQNQVVAAAKATGNDAGKVFPDNRIAAGGELGLMAQATSPGAAGALAAKAGLGSWVTSAIKSLVGSAPDVGFSIKDRQGGGNPEQAMKEMKDKLIQASSGGPEDSRTNNLVSADPDAPMEKADLDWETFFEQGHDLKDLMSIDPKNPNPKIVPEWAELDNVKTAAEKMMGDLAGVKKETVDMGRGDTTQAVNEAKDDFSDDDRVKNGLAMQSETMQYWRLGGIESVNAMSAVQDGKSMLGSLNHEPTQEFTMAAKPAAFTA